MSMADDYRRASKTESISAERRSLNGYLTYLSKKGFECKELTVYCYRLTKGTITVDWWWSTGRWRVQPSGPSGYGLDSLVEEVK